MTLELNDVQLYGEAVALSLLADEGLLTCITGGNSLLRTRWLHVLMGFERPVSGCVSVDGEPLVGGCITHLRRQTAFVPASLDTVGELVTYEPPTIPEVLALHCNRRLGISEANIEDEARRTGATGQKALLLAMAVLRQKPVLLVDSPDAASAAYLHELAAQGGRTVIVATDDDDIIASGDCVVKLAGV